MGLFFLLLSMFFNANPANLITLLTLPLDYFVLRLAKNNKIKLAAYLGVLSINVSIFLVDSGFKSPLGTYLFYLPIIFGAYLFDGIGIVSVKKWTLSVVFITLVAVNYFDISPGLVQRDLGLALGPQFLYYFNLLMVAGFSIFILDYFSKLRKTISDELQRNQANYVALIENTIDQIWSVDDHIRLLTFNSAYADTFKLLYHIEPVTGTDVLKYIEKTQVRSFWEQSYSRALGGEVFSVDHEYQLKGNKRFFELSFHPVYKENRVTGAVISAKDITERKEKLLAEKLYAENLQLLLNSTEDIIFEMDENARCCRVWHAEDMELYDPLEHFLGKTIEELFDIPFKTNMAPAFQ